MDASPFIFKNLTQVSWLRRACQALADVPAEKQIEVLAFCGSGWIPSDVIGMVLGV